jgi:hypothetical protein
MSGDRPRRFLMSEAVDREGEVELAGEVRAADLDQGVLLLRLPDGDTVAVRFSAEHEGLVTEALREHTRRRLRIRGSVGLAIPGRRKSRSLTIQHIEIVEARDDRPIWEIAREISASVPDDEWDRVPSDLALNLDHYLYGARRADEGLEVGDR